MFVLAWCAVLALLYCAVVPHTVVTAREAREAVTQAAEERAGWAASAAVADSEIPASVKKDS